MTTVYEFHPDIDRHRRPEDYPDIREPLFWDVFSRCKAYSILGVEAFYSLYSAMQYISHAGIPGDFVECGVFLGGSVLAASTFAAEFGIRDRRFHLYDTFTGFPRDTPLETDFKGDAVRLPQLASFLSVTRSVVGQSPYPQDLFRFVEGDVKETLLAEGPSSVALLRLDTDDYASTRAELDHLYPRLVPKGVLIVDDYGYFEGARRATDEFFAPGGGPYLQRINLSTRVAVKT